jgi:hypothetical protein
MVRARRWALPAALLLVGCQVRGIIGSNEETLSLPTSGSTSTTSGDSNPSVSSDSTTTTVGTTSVSPTTAVESTGDLLDLPASCAPPSPTSCDGQDDDPFHAMGLGCPGGVDVATSYTGHPDAVMVVDGPLGSSEVFLPREGDKMVVLSTGRAEELLLTPQELQTADPLGCASPLSCPSTTLEAGEPMLTLPEPIEVRRVSDARDCSDDPMLVGAGDCSNSLEQPWVQGQGAKDYVELRLEATVPEFTDGLQYDFAVMSSEYPTYVEHASPYNDMYVAWLESEAWTGNISFDAMGNPISVAGVFLDFQAGLDPATCADEPEVPALAGFAMQCHGATRWLTSTAPVRPGESITLVFALFDLTDAEFDTVVLLDNFNWTCSGIPPVTTPVG